MSEDKGTYLAKADQQTGLVPRLAISLSEARAELALFQTFVKEQMVAGEDYGTIPGTDKPTLLQPGAQKLAWLYGLAPVPTPVATTEDWERGFFYYRYRCDLIDKRTGKVVAAAEGSANSKEKRYRWRYVPEFRATDDEKQRAVRRDKKVGKGNREYTMLVLENDDPYTLVNTLQKMAQKRALVAAVLVACRASGTFTQDIEDMDIIDADFTVMETTTRSQPTTGEIAEPSTKPFTEPLTAQAVAPKLDRKAAITRLSQLQAKVYELTGQFSAPHLKNHLLKHYNVDSVTKLSDEQLVAFGQHLRQLVEDAEAKLMAENEPEDPRPADVKAGELL